MDFQTQRAIISLPGSFENQPWLWRIALGHLVQLPSLIEWLSTFNLIGQILIQAEGFLSLPQPLRFYILLFPLIILTFFLSHKGIHSEVWLFQRKVDLIYFFNLSHYQTKIPVFLSEVSTGNSSIYPNCEQFLSNFSSGDNNAVWK